AGRVVIWRQAVPIAADGERDRVRTVTMRHQRHGWDTVLHAAHFIDATELGDLLPLTKTEFVTGAESRRDTDEPHAPLEGQPNNQQAFTYCFAIDYLPGEDHVIEKPDQYQFWRDYVPKLTPPWPGKLLSWNMSDPRALKERAVGFDPAGGSVRGMNLWTYRRIVDRRNFAEGAYRGDISLINWPQNDYWLGNLTDAPPKIAEHLQKAKQLS